MSDTVQFTITADSTKAQQSIDALSKSTDVADKTVLRLNESLKLMGKNASEVRKVTIQIRALSKLLTATSKKVNTLNSAFTKLGKTARTITACLLYTSPSPRDS